MAVLPTQTSAAALGSVLTRKIDGRLRCAKTLPSPF